MRKSRNIYLNVVWRTLKTLIWWLLHYSNLLMNLSLILGRLMLYLN